MSSSPLSNSSLAPCAELVVVVFPFEAGALGLLEHDADAIAPTSAATLQSAVVTDTRFAWGRAV